MTQRPGKPTMPNRNTSSDYNEFNSFNHTVNDFDIRPERNELSLYTSRCFNHRLTIDSCARDKTLHPTSASYDVNLEQEFREVTSIELVQAIIPFSGYAITENNQALHFQEKYKEALKILIPCGNYTPEELAQIIEDEMNKVGESNYQVRILKEKKRFKFTSDWSGGDHIFKLLFEGEITKNKCIGTVETKYLCQSIGEIVGFLPLDLCYIIGKAFVEDGSEKVYGEGTKFLSTTMVNDKIKFEGDDNEYMVTDILSDNYLIISPNKVKNSVCVDMKINSFIAENNYDLCPTKYIALFINECTDKPLAKIQSNNNAIQNAFMIIPRLDNGKDDLTIINKSTLPSIDNVFHYYPTLQTLSKLTIKFTNKFGELYDFNGKDHVLEFNIRTINNVGN